MTHRGWEPIPAALIGDTRLSLQARAIYMLVRHLIWQETRENEDTMRAEIGTLADMSKPAGCSVTALKEYLAELRRAGWLTTTRARRGHPYTYTIFTTATEPDSGPAQSRNPAPAPSCADDADAEGARAPSGARPRNLVFDAVAEATEANPAISGGQIAKAVAAIREATAEIVAERSREFLAENSAYDEVPNERVDAFIAAMVWARAERYRQMRPTWELTPTSLASHWHRIPGWEQRGERGDGALSASEIARLDLG